MRCTRYTHSCVRIESSDGEVLVIDPGVWSEPEALEGADHVLVTHEHTDHLDHTRIAAAGRPLHAPIGSRLGELEATRLEIGSTVEIGGFSIEVVGGWHARVLDDQEPCVNAGYLVRAGSSDRVLYHPGDALHVPDRPIDTLLVPMQASWLKTCEAIGFVHRIDPRQAVGIHEGQVNERGLAALNRWLGKGCEGVYQWVQPGSTFDVSP